MKLINASLPIKSLYFFLPTVSQVEASDSINNINDNSNNGQLVLKVVKYFAINKKKH